MKCGAKRAIASACRTIPVQPDKGACDTHPAMRRFME